MGTIKILAILVAFSNICFAANVDELIAKTSLALGDEYLKLAQAVESDVLQELKSSGINFENRLDSQSPIIQEYENNRKLALLEYRNVFCSVNCPDGIGNLKLTSDTEFYKREAFSKAQMLYAGSLANGVLLKRATVYATNGEFEEHILNRLYKLISNQQSFDTAARNMNKQLIDLQTAYVNQSGEVIGVDQSLLRDSNYILSQQTQYQGYKSCIDSYKAQDQFESQEYSKAKEQYEVLRKNIVNNLKKVYDFTYEAPGGSEVFKLSANQNWQNTSLSFEEGDKLNILASGKWMAKGAAKVFKDADLVRFGSKRSEGNFGFFSKIGQALSSSLAYVVNPVAAFANNPTSIFSILGETLPEKELKLLQDVKENSLNAISRISNTGLDAGPEGYYFSFSNSASKSVNTSEGNSVNAGISLLGSIGAGASNSSGDSLSSSAGTSGTYGLKLNTVIYPQAPVGALIGSFCDHDPSGGGCTFFPIAAGGIFKVDEGIEEGSTLWLRVNDNGNLSLNSGQMNIEIKKSIKFASYLDQYYEWMDQECDSSGENCGLKNILQNIAYIPNPSNTVEALFIKKFPDFPAEVKTILLAELNYIVEMNVIQRDLNNKEFSQELNDVKVTYCKEQAKLTEEITNNTSELIKTYSNMTQNANSKRLLLDTAKNFYEKELENLNWLRGKNLERIDRYYYLAVNSFNYLYFSDFQPIGSKLPYFEGDYYLENVERMKDQIIDITTVGDLLNPNRGFVVYELSADELQSLQAADFRKRKTQFKVSLQDVMCSGFGLDDQTRVMIDKVGVLLDLDPAREHLFFTNPHVKNAKPMITHGSENQFYDLFGSETEYWMPAQKRKINAWSTQVLTDTNSDYQELRDSRYFDRLSFRKTSLASTWNMDLTDPTLNMFTEGISDPILKGVKFVFWFNSTEIQGDRIINKCLTPPIEFTEKSYDGVGRKVTLEWKVTKDEVSNYGVSHFTIYQANKKDTGYRLRDEYPLSSCIDAGDEYKCEKEVTLSNLAVDQETFFKIRSAYKKSSSENLYSGFYSKPLTVVAQ